MNTDTEAALKREVSSAVDRMASRVTGELLAPRGRTAPIFRTGRITGFNLAAVPPYVLVDMGDEGPSIEMRFFEGYSPSNNDVVIVVWEGNDPWVLGQFA